MAILKFTQQNNIYIHQKQNDIDGDVDQKSAMEYWKQKGKCSLLG